MSASVGQKVTLAMRTVLVTGLLASTDAVAGSASPWRVDDLSRARVKCDVVVTGRDSNVIRSNESR